MATFLSPEVQVNEIDNSGSVNSASTSVGCIILRNTYKGQENEMMRFNNDNDIFNLVGAPNDSNYKDILTMSYFLKTASTCFATRAMPSGATYANNIATSGYSSTAMKDFSSLSISASIYGITNVRTFPNRQYGDMLTSQTMSASDALWFSASSRGAWGNNIRVLVADKFLTDSVKFYDPSTSAVNFPPNYPGSVSPYLTTTQAATAVALTTYNKSITGSTSDITSAYSSIKNSGTTLSDFQQFQVIVQVAAQGSTNYTTQEIWTVSCNKVGMDEMGNSIFAETVINNSSQYIRVRVNPNMVITQDTPPATAASMFMNVGFDRFQPLLTGSNGTFQTNEEASVTNDCLTLYSNPETLSINVFLDGDKPTSVKNNLISICSTQRRDSMAILDCRLSDILNTVSPADNLVRWRNGLTDTSWNPNTSFASCYGQWFYAWDKWNRTYRWLPSSGFVGGVYAYTDQVANPWSAPWGLNRGQIKMTGVNAMAWNPSKTDRDTIFSNQINPIVSFPGQGFVVFGGSTLLNKNSLFQNVEIRRSFLYMENTISEMAKYTLADPNDAVTRLRFVNKISPFLKGIQAGSGIFSYMIICDTTNNTPAIQTQGLMVCDIYISPIPGVKAIKLNFIAEQTGTTTFSESDVLMPQTF